MPKACDRHRCVTLATDAPFRRAGAMMVDVAPVTRKAAVNAISRMEFAGALHTLAGASVSAVAARTLSAEGGCTDPMTTCYPPIVHSTPIVESAPELPKRRPHTCPVCNGVGAVSAGYFNRGGDQLTWSSNSTTLDPCRACDGTGIVWEPAPR